MYKHKINFLRSKDLKLHKPEKVEYKKEVLIKNLEEMFSIESIALKKPTNRIQIASSFQYLNESTTKIVIPMQG